MNYFSKEFVEYKTRRWACGLYSVSLGFSLSKKQYYIFCQHHSTCLFLSIQLTKVVASIRNKSFSKYARNSSLIQNHFCNSRMI